MFSFETFNQLVAQANPAPAPAAPNNPQPLPIWVMLVPALLIFFVFQLMFGGQQRRDQKKKDQLIRSLKKNDRVVTIGGILGQVVSISEDFKEVTLKVDDNARLKMLASSIQTVLTAAQPEDSTKKGS